MITGQHIFKMNKNGHGELVEPSSWSNFILRQAQDVLLMKWSTFLFILLVIPAQSWAWAITPLGRAHELYENNQYPEAEKIYSDLIQKNRNDPQINYNLGDTFYKQDKFKEAEPHFLKALDSKEYQTREYALYNLGNTKYRLGELKEAVDFYNKVLAMNPENEKAKKNRDFVLEQLKKQEEQKKQDQEEQKEDQPNKEEQKEEQGANQNQENQPQENNNPNGKKDDNRLDQTDQPKETEDRAPKPKEGLEGGKQEAERWLSSVEEDSKNGMKEMLKEEARKQGLKSTEKDW